MECSPCQNCHISAARVVVLQSCAVSSNPTCTTAATICRAVTFRAIGHTCGTNTCNNCSRRGCCYWWCDICSFNTPPPPHNPSCQCCPIHSMLSTLQATPTLYVLMVQHRPHTSPLPQLAKEGLQTSRHERRSSCCCGCNCSFFQAAAATALQACCGAPHKSH